ncbi:MAG: hypothetical protein J5696_03715 [Lachnospiraceae bacterium]|nr:hypothetical protein [Lachnospiraceae bacterium]
MNGFFSKKKNIDIIVCLEAMAVSVLAVFAVHDTNTATGAGYSLFIGTGAFTRRGWDFMVDLVIILLIAGLLAVPSLIFKTGLGNAAMFFLGTCAFAVYVRPDRLLAPFTGGAALEFSEKKDAFVSWIPTWLLAVGILVLVFFSRKKEEIKTALICAVLSAVCAVLGFITSAFEIFLFGSGYFVAMPFIRMAPVGEDDDPVVYGLIPGSILFLCGTWRLIMVLSTYHM